MDKPLVAGIQYGLRHVGAAVATDARLIAVRAGSAGDGLIALDAILWLQCRTRTFQGLLSNSGLLIPSERYFITRGIDTSLVSSSTIKNGSKERECRQKDSPSNSGFFLHRT